MEEQKKFDPLFMRNTYRFSFIGIASGYILLALTNIMYNIISLGMHVPWAKTNLRRYFWSNAKFHENGFEYTGTGNELFAAYVKVFAIWGFGFAYLSWIKGISVEGYLGSRIFFAVLFVGMVPFIKYKSRSFLCARTRYRGIRFSMNPDVSKYIASYLSWITLNVVTLGLFYPVFKNLNYKFLMENTNFGNVAFKYDGQSKDLYPIYLKLWMFAPITFGLYYFWFRAEILQYQAQHTIFDNARGSSTITGREILNLWGLNVFFIPLSLGLAAPWIAMYNMSFQFSKLAFFGNIDFEKIIQSKSKEDATSNGASEFFDIDIAA